MTLSSTLKLWKGAVTNMERGDPGAALVKLEAIPPQPTPGVPRARIAFNMGTAHLQLGHLQEALQVSDPWP